MYVIGGLEEEEPIYFQQPKDYIGLYSNTTAYQTLKSSTLVGKRLTTDCLEETSKDLRANESLSFGDSTSRCFFFPAVAAMPIMSATLVWKQRNLHLRDLTSRFLGILFPNLLILMDLQLIKTSENNEGPTSVSDTSKGMMPADCSLHSIV
ncbi:hypothetical protein V6N13_143980 [Hibiscus sabdariffa]|uniref:Uncharacterized protein n=1 Tax=Hibiscus sabdariffa TaxID=183260 RepID=A0ABR2FJ01_9ROSI